MSDEENPSIELSTPIRRGRGERPSRSNANARSKSPSTNRQRGRRRNNRNNNDFSDSDNDDNNEEGDELAPLTKPPQRSRRGPSNRSKNANRDSDADEGDNNDDDPETGDKLSRNATSSKLWNEDDEATRDVMRKRYADLMPYIKPVKTRTYTLSQNVMRFLSMLIFSHALISFEILCVGQGQCFNTYDDPAVNWTDWSYGIVLAMCMIWFVVVPINMHLIHTQNLTHLKLGAFMQILITIILSAFSGICYGNGTGDRILGSSGRKVATGKGSNGGATAWFEGGESWEVTKTIDERWSMKGIAYYGLEGGVGWSEEELNVFAMKYLRNQETMMYLGFTMAFLFLMNFSFQIQHLCNVYYGPGAMTGGRGAE